MVEITLPDEQVLGKPDVSFQLPSGVKVDMWEPDGVILEKATQMGMQLSHGKDTSSTAITYMLIALSSRFDGKIVRYEDIRRLKLRNLTVLMKEFAKLTGTVPLDQIEASTSVSSDSKH